VKTGEFEAAKADALREERRPRRRCLFQFDERAMRRGWVYERNK
jgi:hypothetical protein